MSMPPCRGSFFSRCFLLVMSLASWWDDDDDLSGKYRVAQDGSTEAEADCDQGLSTQVLSRSSCQHPLFSRATEFREEGLFLD